MVPGFCDLFTIPVAPSMAKAGLLELPLNWTGGMHWGFYAY